MTNREALCTVIDGGTPDVTPLSIYDWFFSVRPHPDWQRLQDLGLAVTTHLGVVKYTEHGVTNTSEERREGDTVYRITRKQTPVGTVQKVTRNGWHHED